MKEIQLENGGKVEYVSGLTRYGMQCSECYFKEKDDGDCPRNEEDDYLLCNSDLTGVWRKVEFKPNTAVTSSIDNSIKPEVVTPAAGRKYDAGKPMYNLVPADALEEVVKVLTEGALKYNEPIDQENWRLVPNPQSRYFAAAQRHIWADKRGETIDTDKVNKDGSISKGTDCYHLACAIASMMFMLQLKMEEAKNGSSISSI